MPAVLSKYTNTCGRNVTGNKQLFIAAVADVTSVTVTSGEVSAVTSTAGFFNVQFEQDSYEFKQTAPETKNQIGYEKTHTFRLGKASKANNTWIDLLSDNLNCGFLTIRGDNNGVYWLSGYSVAEVLSRPYKTMSVDLDTGKEPLESDKNADTIMLKCKNGYRDIPFDATLTASIAGGTANFISWV